MKKILKHLDLWDVKRKPTPRANVVHPPLEEPAIWSHCFIIYDKSSSPRADDYMIDADRSTLSFGPEALDMLSDWNLPLKNPAPG
jgi:hypothetical protein